MRPTRHILLLLLFFPLFVGAQNISVASFKLLENDLTANTHGTMEKDFNGEVAALIKVVTTEQGFVFDGGMVGIVKVKQEVSEIYVYVPHGIKKLTIKHPQLGMLRDYYFPISIQKARTYEMVLTTGKVETIVTHSANKQYVMFSVEPADAMVELDDVPLEMDGEGFAEKSMPYGTYHYRVSCPNYHTEAGQVVVSAEGKAEVKVALRPNFGWLQFNTTSQYHGAHVYIDNERIGQLPLKKESLKSGTHKVRVVKSLYKPYEQQVEVTDGNTTPIEIKLVPNYADITLKTDPANEIWLDGKHKGKGEWSGPLEIGDYTVEVKRAAHRTASQVLHVTEVGERIVQLPSPTPIYGVLDITSTPSRVAVYIDGVRVGETPIILDKVLTGLRTVTFKKNGYNDASLSVDVAENTTTPVAATLREYVPEQAPATGTPAMPMGKPIAIVEPVVMGNKRIYTVNGVSFTMIVVDGGTFTMGAADGRGRQNEQPAHQVTLNSYAIGETEVTQELWQAVMKKNPSYYKGNSQNPVEYVSWNECQKFVTMLNRLTGARFRLPTEAEWEYAARGGKQSMGYKYSGSNTIGHVAWHISNASIKTHAVKTKMPNELGLYDMSGNVREWCGNRYYDYSSSPQSNPQGPATGDDFTYRGGGWSDDEGLCRVIIRNPLPSQYKRNNTGLRLALTLQIDETEEDE